jgi:KDO2-lipid IV(A) lauroyltransferase
MLRRFLPPVLNSLNWKKSVFLQNKSLTAPFFEFFPHPNLDYKLTLQSMSQSLEDFLELRASFLKAPSNLELYPIKINRLLLEIDPSSLSEIARMRQGGVLLTAHLGSYEAMGLWLKQLGIPLQASYLPQKPKFVDSWLKILRSVKGVSYAKQLTPISISSSLDSGKLLCLLADQDFRGRSPILSRFLGQRVHCNPIPPFILRIRPNTPFFFCHIETKANRRILFARRIEIINTFNIYDHYHTWLEECIHNSPFSWYGWFHRRFHSTTN